MGFVANISIGGLFLAGLVPAAVLATGLSAMAIWFGKKVDPMQRLSDAHAVAAAAGRRA